MKFFKILLGIVVAIIIVLLLITLFLPSDVKIERSKDIKAPASTIFPLINSMENWQKWSPWHDMDPEAEWEYPGPKSGVGSMQKWTSATQELGTGTIEIIESEPYTHIKTKLMFFGNEFGNGIWKFQEKKGITTVNWTMQAELGFFERWFVLGLEGMMGPIFEKGLTKIKEITESAPNAAVEIMEDEVPNTTVLALRKKSDMDSDKIHKLYKSAFGRLMQYTSENNIEIAGPPVAITNEFDYKTWDFYIGFPITKTIDVSGDFEIVTIPESHVVKAVMMGPYEANEKAYNMIFKYIEDNGFKVSGNMWEVYMNDPAKVKPEEIETHIFAPVIKK